MAVLLDPKDQNDSFLSRGNLDRSVITALCNIKHVIEINDIVIETMAHHPNLQMAAIFRDLYGKLKELNPFGALACIDHQFISDANVIKILTTAIIYEPAVEENNFAAQIPIEKVQEGIGSDSDSENLILLPESFEYVAVTASKRIPSKLIINDYGRVSINASLQSRNLDCFNGQIRALIDKSILGLKAFSLAIGGNGVCSIRVDQGTPIISGSDDKRIRVSISGDVILYQ